MYLAKSIAASGLRNQLLRIDSIAHNVANVNTTAYKNSRLDFKDSLYTTGIYPGPARSQDGNLQKGHGLLPSAMTRDYKPGNIQSTERELDFAIEGEGFFSFADINGGIVYSRNGAFNLSTEMGGLFLVNGDGFYVLDDNGDRIMIPPGTDTINIGENGLMQFYGNDDILGEVTLGIFTFRNLHGLDTSGSRNFIPTPIAGERLQADVTVRQGMLEGSNVDLGEEMTRLIRTQRAFQLSSRALTTADEMQGIANNMRR
ncbi:MAG: flagellar hook-basal body protein [Oscillospiraceae bacterium]|jgi:flagellar basal-body rod protein FlgG|nr:flagellar hook-basal body protein [Oscillospiraceae bacterium]